MNRFPPPAPGFFFPLLPASFPPLPVSRLKMGGHFCWRGEERNPNNFLWGKVLCVCGFFFLFSPSLDQNDLWYVCVRCVCLFWLACFNNLGPPGPPALGAVKAAPYLPDRPNKAPKVKMKQFHGAALAVNDVKVQMFFFFFVFQENPRRPVVLPFEN